MFVNDDSANEGINSVLLIAALVLALLTLSYSILQVCLENI